MSRGSDERMHILRMLEEGKISASEAANLLDALGSDGKPGSSPGLNRRIRIAVSRNNVPEVNVSVPTQLARVVLGMIPKGVLSEHSLNPAEMVRLIEEGGHGKVLDIEKKEEGLHVEIFVE